MAFPFPSSPHWPPTRMMTTVLLGSWFGPSRLQVVEPRVVAAELELDHTGRPVAVLGDVELGDAWSLIGFVVLWAKQKHYNVTILFDRVVTYNISGYEVVKIFYRQIVNFVFSIGADFADQIPIHVTDGKQLELIGMYSSRHPASPLSTQILFVESGTAVSTADTSLHFTRRNTSHGHRGERVDTPNTCWNHVSIRVVSLTAQLLDNRNLVNTLVGSECADDGEKTEYVFLSIDPNVELIAALITL